MDHKSFNDRQILSILSRFGRPQELRLLHISTYFPDYIRTESILDILGRNGINVGRIFTGNTKLKYFLVIFKAIFKLKNYDVIFLAFRGHEVLPFLRLLTKKPIIFDSFVSGYDTLCLDRKIFKPSSIIGRVLKWYDTYLCKVANLVLVDTLEHCEYFKNEFKAKNISYLYLEANGELFRPIDSEKDIDKFIVFWYGNCWPLQGVEIIIRAAGLLGSDRGIVFRLAGPVRRKYKHLIDKLNVGNIEFIDYIPYAQLPLEIAKSNLCLGGHFSDIPKAKRVVAGKTFQFIACAKEVVLGDNPANRELFNGAKGVYFVKMNSEEELAKIILQIKKGEI